MWGCTLLGVSEGKDSLCHSLPVSDNLDLVTQMKVMSENTIEN